jgi:hypothetical protein
VEGPILADGFERGATCAWSATVSPTLPGGCFIDQAYWCADHRNPAHDCQACLPEQSADSWTVLDNGAPCDDGLFCTSEDVCAAGFCSGVDTTCNDGIDCTIEVCDEEFRACEYFANDQLCDDLDPCTTDSCDGQLGCQRLPICPP